MTLTVELEVILEDRIPQIEQIISVTHSKVWYSCIVKCIRILKFIFPTDKVRVGVFSSVGENVGEHSRPSSCCLVDEFIVSVVRPFKLSVLFVVKTHSSCDN